MFKSHPEVVAAVESLRRTEHTVLLCFFTGVEMPLYLDPMKRTPMPATGQVIDSSFGQTYRTALGINPSVHDGCIVFGRNPDDTRYRLRKWSVRLLPPPSAKPAIPNKGSAFNSCLAMSAIDGVDFLVLISKGAVTLFAKGETCPA